MNVTALCYSNGIAKVKILLTWVAKIVRIWHLNMWTTVSLDVTPVTRGGYSGTTINTFIGGGDAIERPQANRAQLLLQVNSAQR